MQCWLQSCIVCTCAVSPQCGWGSVSSNYQLSQMICCTVNNCASCLRCGLTCAGKGLVYLQTCWGTSRKTFDLPYLMVDPGLMGWGWDGLLGEIIQNIGDSKWSLSLSPTKTTKSYLANLISLILVMFGKHFPVLKWNQRGLKIYKEWPLFLYLYFL